MLTAAAFLLLATIPIAEPLTDEAVQIERQTFYDLEAKPVFTQFIIKEDNRYTGRIEVRAWVMKKESEPFIHNNTMLWHDGQTLRRVRFGTYVETHSQTDHELEARQQLPPHLRRPLVSVKREP